MRVGELQRRTGASPRALRYYEAVGLVVSRRLTTTLLVERDVVARTRSPIPDPGRQADEVTAWLKGEAA